MKHRVGKLDKVSQENRPTRFDKGQVGQVQALPYKREGRVIFGK